MEKLDDQAQSTAEPRAMTSSAQLASRYTALLNSAKVRVGGCSSFWSPSEIYGPVNRLGIIF